MLQSKYVFLPVLWCTPAYLSAFLAYSSASLLAFIRFSAFILASFSITYTGSRQEISSDRALARLTNSLTVSNAIVLAVFGAFEAHSLHQSTIAWEFMTFPEDLYFSSSAPSAINSVHHLCSKSLLSNVIFNETSLSSSLVDTITDCSVFSSLTTTFFTSLA